MLSHVRDQIGTLAEGFQADGAFVGLFTRMYIGMLLHIGLLMESLSTILAGIWPSIAVYEQMCG